MEETNTSGKKYLYILVLLALIIVALLIWNFMQRSQLTKLISAKEAEKTELQHDLDSLMKEHNTIKTSYGALADSLRAKDSLIQQNAIEIRKLLDTQYEYNIIRKKLARLQVVAQGYVRQMDSLYTVNRELTAENDRIRQVVKTEQNRNQSLMRDKEELKEKMDQAAFLKAYDVTVTPLKLKSGGTKEQVTDKASRTDRLRVCFTIGENPLVTSGKKNIYIRIQRPDNIIVIKSKYDTFVFNGQTLPYSLREDISYDGKAQNVCVVWTKKDNDKPAMKGQYVVSVFADDKAIGEGTFQLK